LIETYWDSEYIVNKLDAYRWICNRFVDIWIFEIHC